MSLQYFKCICVLTGLITTAALRADSVSFQGSWEQRDGNDIFSLDIVQVAGRICGLHLSTIHNGGKVDEGDLKGDGPSFVGVVRGNVATIQISSARSAAVITGQLTLKGSTLYWKTTTEAKEENYIWEVAAMKRTLEDPEIFGRALAACK